MGLCFDIVFVLFVVIYISKPTDMHLARYFVLLGSASISCVFVRSMI